MKIRKIILLVFTCILGALQAGAYNGWRHMEGTTVPTGGKRLIIPNAYALFTVNDASLSAALTGLKDNASAGQTIALPMPDGSVKDFTVWRNNTMDKDLQARYEGIRTFTGTDPGNSRITAKIDFTLSGFHAMIYDGTNTSFVDPYSNERSDYYISYYRKDYLRTSDLMSCFTKGTGYNALEDQVINEESGVAKTINGSRLRTFRLALACTGEYAVAVAGASPTKAAVLSAMVTSINRVNGVYERELASTMQLIAKEDTLIFLNGSTDPYTNSDGSLMLGENQTTVNARIGSANYDIGHVFSTGGGGIAILQCLCKSTSKAMGVTGLPNPVGDAYDIDFVAHEMGHQFGANHPFNNNTDGSCATNADPSSAYEPSGGTTIMAYAGLCSPDNIQTHSNAYFHAWNLSEIITNLNQAPAATCPAVTISGNKSLSVPSFTASYTIPYKTPFEITAPAATDSIGNDEKTYCWEQWNRGDFGARLVNTHFKGPVFRSFTPDTSRTRIFPTLTKLLINSIAYAGERLPDTARFLTFKLTTRAILNGVGTVNTPDDTIHLDVINTGTPFAVTSPNTSAVSWVGSTTETVKWNVSGTTASPISCANVDIYLSIDGGHTYPYLLASGVPNSGSASVFLPNVVTGIARVKVKGSGNVFFDISNANFVITQGNGTSVGNVSLTDAINVYPVPATTELYVQNSAGTRLDAALMNLQGQTIWKGIIAGKGAMIPVANYSRGLYFLRLTEATSGHTILKKVRID